MKWTTFYDSTIESSNLSHQHLSNIFWYFELVLKMEKPLELLNELDIRFGGIRLPYKPMISYTYEINSLLKNGYITNTHDSDIIVNNKWVGKLIYS